MRALQLPASWQHAGYRNVRWHVCNTVGLDVRMSASDSKRTFKRRLPGVFAASARN